MKLQTAIILALISTVALAQQDQQLAIRAIAESHIAANVPKEEDFDRLLRRDAGRYLHYRTNAAFELQYELLRQGATQTGVAYPKFYIWIQAVSPDKTIIAEGAMRLAAIDKIEFQVTDYVSKAEIRNDPTIIETVFPQALLEKIREKAGITK